MCYQAPDLACLLNHANLLKMQRDKCLNRGESFLEGMTCVITVILLEIKGVYAIYSIHHQKSTWGWMDDSLKALDSPMSGCIPHVLF